MWKRIVYGSLLLLGLIFGAWAPIAAQGMPGSHILQATQPAPGPTIQVTVVLGATPAPAPASGGALPSTTIIIALLVIILLAVVIGGMALMSRRQS